MAPEDIRRLIDDVPAELRPQVDWTQEVCSGCANCPGVHHLADGSVVISNDANPLATSVLLTPEQWDDIKDQIRSGRIE